MRQLGVFAEGAIRPYRTPQNDAWFSHCGGNNRGIIGLSRKALIENIRLGTPGFRSRFHRWCRDGKIEKPDRRLIGLESPRHQSFSLR